MNELAPVKEEAGVLTVKEAGALTVKEEAGALTHLAQELSERGVLPVGEGDGWRVERGGDDRSKVLMRGEEGDERLCAEKR